MVKIIEQKVQSKYIDFNKCEDGLFISDHFISVIDGATSKGKLLWNNKFSGSYAKDILMNELSKLPYDIDGSSAISILNESLCNSAKLNQEFDDNDFREYLRASIIIYSKFRNEIWSFGDCKCIINDQVYDHAKKIDKLISEVRSIVIASELMEGKTVDELQSNDIGREYIAKLLEKQLNFENKSCEYGYEVLNGQRINIGNIVVHPVKDGDTIVLASDGYPYLKLTLEESEKELAKILEIDPLCYSYYKSTKGVINGNISFDDRCYVRFLV